jgi:hypothetical protein
VMLAPPLVMLAPRGARGQIGIRGGGILFRRPQVDREAMREVQ